MAAEQGTGAEGAAHPRPENIRTVFAGLMLGMFLAAVNQTIVAPAMPRIVASLGGTAGSPSRRCWPPPSSCPSWAS